MLKVICLTLILQSSLVKCGLLGYGTGEGSCAAPPFRAYEVQWAYGCPHFAPCCSEFGFCRPLEEWDYGKFRDCNGVSNGTPLLPETIAAEEAAGPYEGKPAGEIGPPPDVIRAHHPEIKKPHHDPHAPPHPAPHHPVHPPPHPHPIAHPPHPVPHPPIHHAAHAPHPGPHHHIHHVAHPSDPHPAVHPPPPPVHNGPHPLHTHLAPHPPVHHAVHSPHPAPHLPVHPGPHPPHPHHPVHLGPHPQHPGPHHPVHTVHHAEHPPHAHPAGHPPVHHVTHDPAPHPHISSHVQHHPHHQPYVAPEPYHPTPSAPEPHQPSYVHHPDPHPPPYTAPEPHHPTYVAPKPHHPTYVEPHQATYATPEHHQPTYGAPEPHQPTYAAPEAHSAHKPLIPPYVAPELRHYGTPEPSHPPPYHAPEPPKPSYHAPVPQPPTLHVPSQPLHSPQHHPLHPHHPAPHHSPPHLIPHPPAHFSVHSPVHPAPALAHPLTHVSPIKPAQLSHKPFVSFGSSSTVTAKEPTIVNTVELRKAAMEDKPVEKEKSSSTPSEEPRKAKAFESENQFKTSTTNQIKPSVTPDPVTVEEEITTEMIRTSDDLRNGAFDSLSQEPMTEAPSETDLPTTAPIAPMGTIAALTNIFSTPAPIIFSTLTPSISTSKSSVDVKDAFTSFGQNNELSNSATDEKEDSLITISSTGDPRPVALKTTRQPKILQAVTPLVNIFASTPSPTFLPSPTILPNPTINLGSASTLQENPTTAIRTSNNPILTTQQTEINLGQPRPIVVQPSPPSSISQIRIPTPQRQNAALTIPVAKKSQDTSQCQHPRGGGSYTCISFGVPHDPIFAFHTVQGDDGFFFGTGSGFPEHKIVNGPATIRRRRKLQKVLIEKELARIRKEKLMRAKKEMIEDETNIHILKTINDKLPITSYQKKLLEKSESEKIFQKLNKNKNQSTNPLEDENKNIYQTNFVSDSTEEMKSVKKSLIKTVTTPKVQLYEYPVEETISYLTEPEKNSATTIPSDFSDEDLKTTPRRLYPTSYESLDESLSSTQP